MKRVLIASVLMMAFGFGTASEVQAQIVYGYSSSASDGGVMSAPASMYYGQYQSGYSSYSPAYNTGSYSSGSRYSPLSIYVYPPIYPPMGSNYRLSPVRKYGSSMYGMGSGFSGSYSGMPMGMSPWMSSGYGRMSPMWMRRR